MSTGANRAALLNEILAVKTLNVIMPNGSVLQVEYEFGDDFDHVLGAILPSEYSTKKALFGIHDATYKKLTTMEQLEANTGSLYLLGPLKTKATGTAGEVSITVTSEFARKEYVFDRSYTVLYHQQLIAISLRKASTYKQVWVHEGALVNPATTIGSMIPLMTSEPEVIAHFVTSTVYSGLGLP